MPRSFQLVVIGTGTAAMVAATRVRAAGWSVAVTDFRPYGGTCALRGCDPKKMLIGGVAAIDHARRMQGKGVAGAVDVAWPELMAFKRSFTDPIPGKHEERYASRGIETFHGQARFTGPNTLDVGGAEVTAEHILIASGAEPVTLGIPGEDLLVTNEYFLSMSDLPRRIALVGGGYIAAEFAHIAARAGVHTTILQRAERMLAHFEPELVDLLMTKFRELGINVQLCTRVEAIEKARDGFVVRTSSPAGKDTFEADLVVHAAGRRPALTGLELDAGGVATENGRLKLNQHLQSVSNPAVYAAGDAAGAGPPLTPVSSHDAKVVAANLLEGLHHRPDYRGVPSVAFTVPPIARVGMTEAEARERGMKLLIKSQHAPDWFTARQAAEAVYGFKVMVEEDSGRILGAHLVGPQADEVINLFVLAVRHGLTADDLKATMFAYPTGASDIGYML